MEWYRINLNQDQVCEGKIVEIQNKFLEIFMNSQNRESLVMYAKSVFEENNFTTLYFSPECNENLEMRTLLLSYSAKACDALTYNKLALLDPNAKHSKK